VRDLPEKMLPQVGSLSDDGSLGCGGITVERSLGQRDLIPLRGDIGANQTKGSEDKQEK
jgi:hypothetical protein